MNSRTRIDAATGAPNAGWSRRKGLALAVRVAIVVVPFVGAWIAIRLTQRWYYHPEGWPGVVIWVVQAAAVGLLASRAISLYSRRLTPLVALFEMTLVFPDYAPSRFGVALRAGSVGRLLRQPELRLSEDAQEAAEQAVQLVAHLRRHEPLTRGHTERVRAYAELIGEEMGLDEADLNRLRWGALLHDVGKLAVPESILNKKGLPTRDEWEILRNHPVAGAKLLEPLHEWLGEWVRAASEHHEWWDGNGYPAGLRGEEISLSGRITAVADAYDVITSRRSYKDPLSAERAREELVAAAGTQFDPAVVRAMLQVGLRPGARAGWLAWIFELPGLAPLAGSATVAPAAIAAASVAVASVVGPAGPLTDAPPRAIAFVDESAEHEDGSPSAPVLDFVPPTSTTAAPAVTVPPEFAITIPPQATTEPPRTDGASTGPVLVFPAPSGSGSTSTTTTSATPTTTAAPATVPATVPATTATVPLDDCARAHAGETDLANAILIGCDLTELVGDGLDLSNADLTNAILTDARLTNVDLTDAELAGADLTGTQITGGSLNGADLSAATLVNITLTNVSLVDLDADQANLTNAIFDQIVWHDGSAQNADLERAVFIDADLAGIDFSGANLRLAVAQDATLVDADLEGATLALADLRNANIRRADLEGADLTLTDLRFTAINNVNLRTAVLTQADFQGATGVPADIAGAIFDRTICPDGERGSVPCW